jgi:hypothetical protein
VGVSWLFLHPATNATATKRGRIKAFIVIHPPLDAILLFQSAFGSKYLLPAVYATGSSLAVGGHPARACRYCRQQPGLYRNSSLRRTGTGRAGRREKAFWPDPGRGSAVVSRPGLG